MITVAMTIYKWTWYTDNTIKSIINNKKNKVEFLILLDNPGENEKNKLDQFIKNWDNKNGILNYYIQDSGGKINGLWNNLLISKNENILVINDDIEISQNYDEVLENTLGDNVINPYFFTPYAEGLQWKYDCIAGHAWAIKKEFLQKILPIDPRIRLYYGDDWIFHRAKEIGLSIVWIDAVQVLHYTSKTCENPEIIEDVRKIINEDTLQFIEILKEHNWEDRRFNPKKAE